MKIKITETGFTQKSLYVFVKAFIRCFWRGLLGLWRIQGCPNNQQELFINYVIRKSKKKSNQKVLAGHSISCYAILRYTFITDQLAGWVNLKPLFKKDNYLFFLILHKEMNQTAFSVLLLFGLLLVRGIVWNMRSGVMFEAKGTIEVDFGLMELDEEMNDGWSWMARVFCGSVWISQSRKPVLLSYVWFAAPQFVVMHGHPRLSGPVIDWGRGRRTQRGGVQGCRWV